MYISFSLFYKFFKRQFDDSFTLVELSDESHLDAKLPDDGLHRQHWLSCGFIDHILDVTINSFANCIRLEGALRKTMTMSSLHTFDNSG